MFEFCVNKSSIAIKRRELVVSGSVNAYRVRFSFSSDWDGLSRMAVFRGGEETVNVLLDETNECVIPWEVLIKPKMRLKVGVYGTRGGDVVLPTVWADCGFILEGAAPDADGQLPTPDLWRQELDRKGDGLKYDGLNLALMSGDSELSTVRIAGDDREEVTSVPGKDGFSPTVSTEAVDGGTKVTITDINGEHPFTVYDGKDGAAGVPGPAGEQGEPGKAGEPGKDATINGENAVTTDSTLTMGGDTLSVATPVNGVIRQADFDALPPEEQNHGLYVVKTDGYPLQGVEIEEYDTTVAGCAWHVRKWSNGYCELTSIARISGIRIEGNWGGKLYDSPAIGPFNLPLSLEEKYTENVTIVRCTYGDSNTFACFLSISNGSVSKNTTVRCYLVRPEPVNADVTADVSFYITGRWK